MRRAVTAGLFLILAAAVGWGQVFSIDQTIWRGPVVAPPSGVVAQASGTRGPATIYYWVTARYPAGVSAPAGPARAVGTVPIALLAPGAAVTIQWAAATGATGYDVIRLATPQFPNTGTCLNCVVASNIAVTNFLDNGGAVVNWPTAGTVLARPSGISAQVNNRDQLGPVLNFSGGAAGYWPTIGSPKIQTGTTGSYFTNFTTGDNLWQIYARDAVATGYTDGLSVALSASGGNGTGAVRPIQLLGRAEKGSNLGELYGASVYAIQDDGSVVRPNLYGLTSWLQINETNVADAPNGYVASVLGIYQTAGVNPVTAFANPGGKAALMGVVKDGSANNTPDAAVLAMLEGDSTGTTVNAAFKAVTVRSTAGGQFMYGLDLRNQPGPAQPTIHADGADIKLHYWTTINNPAADSLIVRGIDGSNFFTDFHNQDGAVLVRATQYIDNADGADFASRHARGTIAVPVILQNGDELGAWRATGYDGVDFVGGAEVSAVLDNVPGANDMPTALIFSTSNDGAVAMTERMRLPSLGGVGITSLTFAELGAQANGTAVYCSNCDPTVGVVIACTSAGATTGAMAFKIAGLWDCLSR